MANASFKVHTDGLEALEKQYVKVCSAAEHHLAVQMEKDTRPFVPSLTGSMSQRTIVNGNTVIYPAPYARYLYFGKLMVDPTTGSAWASKNTSKILTDRDLVFTKTMHGQAQDHWFEVSKAQNLDKWLKIADKEVKKRG